VQIADVAGGALMAAFGILAALRSGQGQFVDIAMADGALSLLAMPAAQTLAGGQVPRRGEHVLAGRLLCYRPYPCADGWVSVGALEPKFWAAFCHGVERPDLVAHQFDPPGSPAHAEVEAILAARTRAEWEAFNAAHDCCLEPVLELDEALADARQRGMVDGDTLANPIRLSETPAQRGGPPPGLGEHSGEVLG
jgi:crotonobetainyl-CoA:carnitine CoA-transferase CaiB-like acyl-CoA transferase